MVPCECMVFQQDDDSVGCRTCRGDWYACECPVRHRRACRETVDPTVCCPTGDCSHVWVDGRRPVSADVLGLAVDGASSAQYDSIGGFEGGVWDDSAGVHVFERWFERNVAGFERSVYSVDGATWNTDEPISVLVGGRWQPTTIHDPIRLRAERQESR